MTSRPMNSPLAEKIIQGLGTVPDDLHRVDQPRIYRTHGESDRGRRGYPRPRRTWHGAMVKHWCCSH